MYQYNALVERVIDGDTVDISVDLGFKVWSKQRMRLLHVDTAEKNTPFGKATKDLLKKALEGKMAKVQVHAPDKYGRYLAEIYLGSDVSINQQMIDAKVAKGYEGDSKAGLWTPEELAVVEIHLVLK